MWLNELYRRLMGRTSRRIRRRFSRQRTFIHPRLERLEDRTLLSAPVDDLAGLIAAIDSANEPGGSTTITLASDTTFDFTPANNSTNGNNALPVIQGNITLVGNGDLIERTGSNAFRSFDVAESGSLNLQNVRLDGGLAFGNGAAAEGGAIYSSGNLNLSGVTVQSNEAQGSNGVGVSYSTPGTNGSNASGGGVFMSKGSLTVTNDSFIANKVVGGGGAGGNGGNAFGGALFWGGGVSVTGGSNSFKLNYALGGNGDHGGAGIEGTFLYDFNGGHGALGGDGGSGGSATGGGLYMAAGSATLTDDALSGNYALGGMGGAGGNGGSDSSGSAGGYGGNGGIGGNGGDATGSGFSVAATDSFTLSNATLSGNLAGHNGRSGANVSGGAGGNAAGGGLYTFSNGSVVLINDTLSSNVTQGGNGGSGAYVGPGGNGAGSGLYLAGQSILANTLIAENTVNAGAGGLWGSASGPDIDASVLTSYHDLFGNSSGFEFNSLALGDIYDPASVGLDPNGLQNNGGPLVGAPGSQQVLQTIALESGSPAIDAGSTVDPFSAAEFQLPSTDERGYSRTIGNPDIGAVEYQYDLAVTCSAPSSVQPGQEIDYLLTVTNNGPDTVGNGDGVTLTDVLPGGFTYETGGAIGWTKGYQNDIFTAIGPVLASGASATIEVDGRANSTPGTLYNMVSVGPTSWDINNANNSVSFQTMVGSATSTSIVDQLGISHSLLQHDSASSDIERYGRQPERRHRQRRRRHLHAHQPLWGEPDGDCRRYGRHGYDYAIAAGRPRRWDVFVHRQLRRQQRRRLWAEYDGHARYPDGECSADADHPSDQCRQQHLQQRYGADDYAERRCHQYEQRPRR